MPEGKGKTVFDATTLLCYIDIVNHMSAVFSEQTTLLGLDGALIILQDSQSITQTQQLDRQLLAAWLNFANGAVGLDDLVDTDGDTEGDSVFSGVINTAESVRLDLNSEPKDIGPQNTIMEIVNNMDQKLVEGSEKKKGGPKK